MNSTQRELLILAAKAAGLSLEWEGNPEDWQPMYYEGKTYHAFEPHTDDAQCLQLARKLGISIDYSKDKCAWSSTPIGVIQEYFDQYGCEGWHKSDREAVVSVAAQMGRML